MLFENFENKTPLKLNCYMVFNLSFYLLNYAHFGMVRPKVSNLLVYLHISMFGNKLK